MRHFYIFQIKSEIESSLKSNPFELFKALQTIYYEKYPSQFQYAFISQLIEKMDIKEMDISLFKTFKDNYFYTKYKNVHSMHDVYRKETTILKLHKTYLSLKSSAIEPCFLKFLKKYHRLFFCDFESMDYFWLDSLKETSCIKMG